MNGHAQHPDPVTWLRQVTGQQSIPSIARAVGRSHTTVYRWKRAGIIPADTVVEISIRLGVDFVEALVATGWLSPDDAKEVNLEGTLTRLPAVQLTGEIHRRAKRRTERGNTHGI